MVIGDFSPIYDCGSCLNPMYDDVIMNNISKSELKNLAMNCFSCLKENGKRIHYMSYIKEMKNDDCNQAIIRMFNKINNFIDNISCMSSVRKDFYKEIIYQRYSIIQMVYNMLIAK